jgi:hypothetical protein
MNVSGWVRLSVLVSLVLLGTVAVAGPAGSGYLLVKSVPIGAAVGESEYFDYVTVDPAGRRVYIAHGAEVKVLDADNFSKNRWNDAKAEWSGDYVRINSG